MYSSVGIYGLVSCAANANAIDGQIPSRVAKWVFVDGVNPP